KRAGPARRLPESKGHPALGQQALAVDIGERRLDVAPTTRVRTSQWLAAQALRYGSPALRGSPSETAPPCHAPAAPRSRCDPRRCRACRANSRCDVRARHRQACSNHDPFHAAASRSFARVQFEAQARILPRLARYVGEYFFDVLITPSSQYMKTSGIRADQYNPV